MNLKNNFEIPFDLENLPIPANESTQLIPNKELIIEVMRFACNV